MLKAEEAQGNTRKHAEASGSKQKHVEARGSTQKHAVACGSKRKRLYTTNQMHCIIVQSSVACFEGGGGIKAIQWTACCCQKVIKQKLVKVNVAKTKKKSNNFKNSHILKNNKITELSNVIFFATI
jgi:hypothetical protein